VAWRVTLPARILLLARALLALLLPTLLAHILAGVLGLLALIALVLVLLAFGHSSFSFVEPSNAQTTHALTDRFSSDVEIAGPFRGPNVTAEQIAVQRKTAWKAQLSRTYPCCCSRKSTVRKWNSDCEIPAVGVSASPHAKHDSTIRGPWIISPSN
jgi:hypothetical protein